MIKFWAKLWKKTCIVHVTGFGNQEGEFKLSVNCAEFRPPSGSQEIKCGESVTNTTIGVHNIYEAGYCGVKPSKYGGLLYTLSNFTGEVTVSTFHDQTTFDSLIQVLQDTVAGSCVAGNDDGDNFASDCIGQFRHNGASIEVPKSRLTFNAVEIETYVVIVSGYDGALSGYDGTFYDGNEGEFTLSAECSAAKVNLYFQNLALTVKK